MIYNIVFEFKKAVNKKPSKPLKFQKKQNKKKKENGNEILKCRNKKSVIWYFPRPHRGENSLNGKIPPLTKGKPI